LIQKRVGDAFASAVRQRYGTYYRVGPPSRILCMYTFLLLLLKNHFLSGL